MLTFHAVGDWSPEQVHYEAIASTRLIVPEVEQLIDEAWQRVSQQPDVHLFDGPMVRLESWQTTGDHLHLTLSHTSYKPFLGTNLHHPELADRYGRAILANPVGVSPALETSDGWLMFGRRNGSVAYYPNRVHPFAGALEPRDASNVFAAVRRELAEELSLTDADVEEIRCTGIAEDVSIRQPELIFRAKVGRTREQIEANVDRTEHHESWAVRAEAGAVEATLADPHVLTPVAVASLLLWGRAQIGAGWFDANSLPSRVPPAWRVITDEAQRDALVTELEREVPTGHVLHGQAYSALAVLRRDADWVLFKLGNGRIAAVHLTRHREHRPEWPFTELFDDPDAAWQAEDWQ